MTCIKVITHVTARAFHGRQSIDILEITITEIFHAFTDVQTCVFEITMAIYAVNVERKNNRNSSFSFLKKTLRKICTSAAIIEI